MAIMDDETLQMYVEESKEHLESIESDLLEVEQSGENIDEDLVNKVFRAAHSVKGGAGFIGLETIKNLSHKIENVLDMVRNYQLVPSPDLVNTVLVAFDRLGELLDDVLNSNDEDVSDHIAALKSIVSDSLNDEEKGSLDNVAQVYISENGPFFEIAEFDLNQAVRGGKTLYVLDYDLIGDVQKQNKTPMDVIKGLNDGGVILDIYIGIEMVGDLDSVTINPSLPMQVLFSSIIEPDLIGMMMGLNQEKVTAIPIDEAGNSKYLNVTSGQGEQELQTSAEVGVPSTEDVPAAPVDQPVDSQKSQSDSANQSVKQSKTKKAPAQEKSGDEGAGKKKMAKTMSKTDSLRVPVAVLDQLMNRAGELVLARNELLQSIAGGDKKSMVVAGQRVDLVTSELQEAIMLTRMQPVGNIFSKFPRVVRDMSRDLGKEMELTLEGKEVELDKTIIEGLGDPLTHLVRNSCDHGIELPSDRIDKNKAAVGSICLRAFHESGQVIIEIEDDGKGLDAECLAEKAIEKGLITDEQAESMSAKEKTALIMLPGFSTADQVTEVSGRGVGMDVVKTNLDALGGQVELISQVDKGTVVRIKLPLTLAIIPSLLVSSCGERFALPQVNVGELLRIQASEIREKIEKIGGADVLILRGELIPLLQLNNVLGLTQTFYDQKAGEFRSDRRSSLIDERIVVEETPEQSEEAESSEQVAEEQVIDERRSSSKSDVSIVVLQAGNFKYGLVVEEVHDTVEIVVKPLGRHLHKCAVYAGATIMGDGHVALILDVAGVAKVAELRTPADAAATTKSKSSGPKNGATRQTLLLFHNGSQEYCAVPLHMVLRVEQIQAKNIEIKGGKKVIQYRGGNLPVYALEEVANVEMLEEREALTVVIFVVAGREVGLLAVPPLDVIEQDLVLDEETLRQPGISGSAIIRDQTTLMVDIFGFMQALNPEWFESRGESLTAKTDKHFGGKPILLAEDSEFFRDQVSSFFESEGYAVIGFEDGLEAWNYLTANPDQVGLVVTDIEMPNMDGFELAKRIKEDTRLKHLKIIALTSLAGEEDVIKGREVGIDDYQVKLDKEKLMQGIHRLLN